MLGFAPLYPTYKTYLDGPTTRAASLGWDHGANRPVYANRGTLPQEA